MLPAVSQMRVKVGFHFWRPYLCEDLARLRAGQASVLRGDWLGPKKHGTPHVGSDVQAPFGWWPWDRRSFSRSCCHVLHGQPGKLILVSFRAIVTSTVTVRSASWTSNAVEIHHCCCQGSALRCQEFGAPCLSSSPQALHPVVPATTTLVRLVHAIVPSCSLYRVSRVKVALKHMRAINAGIQRQIQQEAPARELASDSRSGLKRATRLSHKTDSCWLHLVTCCQGTLN